MEITIIFDGRYGEIDIDENLLSAVDNKSEFIASEIEPYISAMLDLDKDDE